MSIKPPLPPFTRESAIEKVRLAEDAWNSRDPERVSQVYSSILIGVTARSLSTAAQRWSVFTTQMGERVGVSAN